MIVKICGITSFADGLAALEAGADWLGFVRWPKSKRFIEAPAASEIIERLRDDGFVFDAVGVYVDAPEPEIRADFEIGIDRVQLHGAETPDFAVRFLPNVLKALRFPDPAAALAAAQQFPDIDLLIDAFDPELPGGTGRQHDYEALAPLIAARPVILAGGLQPENVAGIVERLAPKGVDVSSGVESAPGVKDHAKVRAFVAAAREGARRAALAEGEQL